jgi:tetratricopeptide (TPR) repeat protein
MCTVSRTSRKVVQLVLVLCLARLCWSSAADEVSEMIARAEALYYEADFEKSVELLLRADDLLKKQADRLKEKTDVKLQLALGFIGLNDSAKAKMYLGELFALDPDRVMDPGLYSPKVIRLAEDAKVENESVRCQSIVTEAQSQLQAGNGDALVKLMGPNRVKCSSLSTLNSQAADLLFKQGVDIYKKAQMAEALQKFRAALLLEPKHELAAQYVELTLSKLDVIAERALLAWRKDFTGGDFASATRDYRELSRISSSQTMDQVRAEYRSALSNLVDSWNKACTTNDSPAMEKLRVQVNEMLPEPSFGTDILARMTTCAPSTGCIQMDSQLALTRLKTRVEPQFSNEMKALLKVGPMRVTVKTRINEKGDVVSTELQGGSPLLYNPIRNAVDRWKFSPAITEAGPRCVDTEIPFVINFTNQD